MSLKTSFKYNFWITKPLQIQSAGRVHKGKTCVRVLILGFFYVRYCVSELLEAIRKRRLGEMDWWFGSLW